MNDQRSVTDQLQSLIPLANKAGLYDAADWLTTRLAAMNAESKSSEVVRVVRKVPYDLLIARDIAHEARVDTRSVCKELDGGYVRGVAGDRIRRVIARYENEGRFPKV
jgi:hypothetical protein